MTTTISAEAEDVPKRSWSGQLVFLFAAVGCAVGLGNLWRFPYIAGENGGGAFILIYLACVLLFGAPLMMAEIAIGRRGGGSAIATMRTLTGPGRAWRGWMVIGVLAVVIPLIGLAYYAVVAGWSIAYVLSAASGRFQGIDADRSGEIFGSLTGDPAMMLVWHALFVGITTVIVARGVRRGLEIAFKILMPALFAALLALVAYAAVEADFAAGVRFLFNPDFSRVTPAMVMMAAGQAFFSLALGVGAMITYGAYLPRDVSIPRVSFVIAGADTLVAILAGLAIFPVLFAAGLSADSGPGLLFVAVPVAFGAMPFGAVFGTVFFFLVFAAALTSSIGMLEPAVAWLEERRWIARPAATVGLGLIAFVVGVLPVLSFNILADYHPLDAIPLYAGKNFFDIIDFTIANILILASAIALALFAGWVLPRADAAAELGLGTGLRFRLWRMMVRYVAPIPLVAIFIAGLL